MSEMLMIKPIRSFLSYSSYTVRPLTYHFELIDGPGRQGNDDGAITGLAGEIGCPRRLFRGFLSQLKNKFPLTYHSGLIDEDLALFAVAWGEKDRFAFYPLRFHTRHKPYYKVSMLL
jgi:hypothetical protein